jgi:hypothetical protein
MGWRVFSFLGVVGFAIIGTLYAISNPGRAALQGTGDAAAWIQAWWSIAAIVVAFTYPGIEAAVQERKEAARRKQAAAMVLLVGVRRWYRAVEHVVSDVDVWRQSGGTNGQAHGTLPEPKLDGSLDRAPDLELADVQAILDAMAFRDNAQGGIDAALQFDVTDHDDIAKAILEDGRKLADMLAPIVTKLEQASGFQWRMD